MAIRPIDIARALGVSATTLRTYEDMGLAPRARRTAAGYRVYTEEHAAYFACVREMLPAFSLSFLRRVLAKVQAGDAAGAFWLLNEAQAALWSDRQAARRFVEHIVEKSRRGRACAPSARPPGRRACPPPPSATGSGRG